MARGQPAARQLRADRAAAGAARRPADRGHVRHRRQRHRARVRQGPRHRPRAVDDDHRRLGAVQGRHRQDGPRRRAVRRGGPSAPRGRRDPQPGRVAGLHDREVPQRERRQDPGRRQDRGRGRRRVAEEALEGEDTDAIKAAATKLGESSQKMGAAMYANADAGAAPVRRRPPSATDDRRGTSSTPRSSTRAVEHRLRSEPTPDGSEARRAVTSTTTSG